jgi:hypothetical protein
MTPSELPRRPGFLLSAQAQCRLCGAAGDRDGVAHVSYRWGSDEEDVECVEVVGDGHAVDRFVAWAQRAAAQSNPFFAVLEVI